MMMDDEGRMSSELASLLDAEKISDPQSSEKLREFYKKLIRTDAQIKKLREGFERNNIVNNEILKPERYKRSLKFVKLRHPGRKGNNKQMKDRVNATHDKLIRYKRLYDDIPDGFVIEKKKVMVQYKPSERRRQFPKCSHAHKGSSHEQHLKHPFYQNSQRLDELLDHVIDKNLPEIITDPLKLDLLFSKKSKCNHKTDEAKSLQNNNCTNKFAQKGVFVNRNNEKVSEIFNPDNYMKSVPETPQPFNERTQSVTLFDKDAENNKKKYDSKMTQNVDNKDITDRSSKFMAKIHANNNPITATNTYLEQKPYKYNNWDQSNPDFNVDQYRNSYRRFFDHLPENNEMNAREQIDELKVDIKDLPDHSLLDIIIDETSTKKSFDMNLDYSEILLSTPNHDQFLTTRYTKHTNNDRIVRSHNIRRLLQIDEEDDETLGYEDLKEVLADEMKPHDEIERFEDRAKRDALPDVYNHNWKGPIPLFPDELNAIIQQAALENIKLPINSKDVLEVGRSKSKVSDTDYIEDYFDNKYDRLVEMAQAYSDYGVLDGKKEEADHDKVHTNDGKDGTRVKLSLDKSKILNGDLRGRQRKGSQPSEGIRFEIKPDKCKEGNCDNDLLKTIQKHIKFSPGKKCPEDCQKTSPIPYMSSEFDFFLNPSSISILDKDHHHITHKYDTKTMGHHLPSQRSLKSVDNTDDNEEETDNTNNDTIRDKRDSSIYEDGKFIGNDKNNNVDNSNVSGKDVNNNNSTMGVSDFFAMMSKWFKTLADLSNERNFSAINSSRIARNLSEININGNDTEEIHYPSYDSDMIENIGHRSRVLMSIKVKNGSLSPDLKPKVEEFNKEPTTFSLNADSLTTKNGIQNATSDSKLEQETTALDKGKVEAENKNISKRSVSQDSLTFWNDIYDDEYGVRQDYLETMRDKHSVKSDDFVKKSRNWIQGTVKKIANKIHGKDNKKSSVKEKSSTAEVKKVSMTPKRGFNRVRRRRIRNSYISDEDSGNDFAALTANMKKVVREAAKAVQNTRNLKVREDTQEQSAASSLMQQLVSLMSDVVDFQVQQKTCTKLPADLQKFLEWLTSSSDKESHLPEMDTGMDFDTEMGYNRFEKSTSEDLDLLAEDDKAYCVGVIEAVQDLLHQFDGMNDEDKSKMTGVKEYLEEQLDFLNKRLNSLEESKTFKYYKKREAAENNLRNQQNKKRRMKRRLNKYIKNFGKKHTRSTASNIESGSVAPTIQDREVNRGGS